MSFEQSPTFFHSVIVEGLPADELLTFAESIKMDQAARGASHCEVTLYQVDGVDKLESRNVFATIEGRDDFVSRMSAPNLDALAGMGIRMSSHVGSVVSHSSAGNPPQKAVSAKNPAPVSSQSQPNKSQWPELKNTPSDQAVRIIASHRPDVEVMLVPQGSMVTMDMRMDRVRVFHDSSGNVSSIPRVG